MRKIYLGLLLMTSIDAAAGEAMDYSNKDFSEVDVSQLSFVGANLQYAKFRDMNLEGKDFTGADLGVATFNGSNLKNVKFDRAILDTSKLRDCNLEGATFFGAILKNTEFNGSRLAGVNFTVTSKFDGVNLSKTDLTGANLSQLKLSELYEAKLVRANLKGATLKSPPSFTRTDFSNANLRDIKAVRANFDEAILKNADVTGALLTDTSYEKTNIREANWSEVKKDVFAVFSLNSKHIPAVKKGILDQSPKDGIQKLVKLSGHPVASVFLNALHSNFVSDGIKSNPRNAMVMEWIAEWEKSR